MPYKLINLDEYKLSCELIRGLITQVLYINNAPRSAGTKGFYDSDEIKPI